MEYDLPLTVLSYRDLYGWSMDDIVQVERGGAGGEGGEGGEGGNGRAVSSRCVLCVTAAWSRLSYED